MDAARVDNPVAEPDPGRPLWRSAAAGAVATAPWAGLMIAQRATLPAQMPKHAATRGRAMSRMTLEAVTIAGAITAVNYTNHNGTLNGGEPNDLWQSSALTAAVAAPLLLHNTIRSGPHTAFGFGARMALGTAIAAGAGSALHVLNYP